jgi:hypothetical protein
MGDIDNPMAELTLSPSQGSIIRLLSTILLQMDAGYIIQDPDHTVELIPDFSGFKIMPNSATHKYNYTLPELHSAIFNSKKGTRPVLRIRKAYSG